ncbi:hypothetical protein LTR28_005418 [Elasticomyces elasticus]|nr:hypothetical protein LTR28_005418 [Elasticomyces elasticus]
MGSIVCQEGSRGRESKASSGLANPLAPGCYKLRWRVQFFKVNLNILDQKTIKERHKTTFYTSFDNCGNPFNWPIRLSKNNRDDNFTSSRPDLPGRPPICFSAGYGKHVGPIKAYFMDYSRGHDMLSTQALLTPKDPGSNTRVEYWLEQSEYFGNMDEGWIYLEGNEPFQVVEKRRPILITCAIDSGNWLGGFRFGQVDFIKCTE